MIVHWAHVDEEGRVVSWGQARAGDVFLQPLAEGLTAVGCPPDVNGWAPWRLAGEEWILETEGTP